jgi:hypothetical protein
MPKGRNRKVTEEQDVENDIASKLEGTPVINQTVRQMFESGQISGIEAKRADNLFATNPKAGEVFVAKMTSNQMNINDLTVTAQVSPADVEVPRPSGKDIKFNPKDTCG